MPSANPILQKLDGLTARFEEVSTLITDPEVIADRNRFVRLTKEYKGLEELLAAKRDYEQLLANLDEARSIVMNDDDPDLKEMAREEIAAGEERLPALEEQIKLMLVPADPEDAKNAIVEIRGGTGGDEAALFAGDLYRMYAKYCEIKGWGVAVSSVSEGTSGGFKEIIFTVTGESEEIRIECTETRDQPKNKERALSRLRSFIYDREHSKYMDDIASRRKTMVSTGDRSAKIRTYNFPQGRITDHRINYTIYNLPAFMNGDIQDCIDRLTIAENAERIKESEL